MEKSMPASPLTELIESRLSSLKLKPFSELLDLVPCQSEKVNCNGKTLTLSVWKDQVSDDEIRVVVQIYRHLFMGIGRMAADGFRIDKNGTWKKLPQVELYEFS